MCDLSDSQLTIKIEYKNNQEFLQISKKVVNYNRETTILF